MSQIQLQEYDIRNRKASFTISNKNHQQAQTINPAQINSFYKCFPVNSHVLPNLSKRNNKSLDPNLDTLINSESQLNSRILLQPSSIYKNSPFIPQEQLKPNQYFKSSSRKLVRNHHLPEMQIMSPFNSSVNMLSRKNIQNDELQSNHQQYVLNDLKQRIQDLQRMEKKQQNSRSLKFSIWQNQIIAKKQKDE